MKAYMKWNFVFFQLSKGNVEQIPPQFFLAPQLIYIRASGVSYWKQNIQPISVDKH